MKQFFLQKICCKLKQRMELTYLLKFEVIKMLYLQTHDGGDRLHLFYYLFPRKLILKNKLSQTIPVIMSADL